MSVVEVRPPVHEEMQSASSRKRRVLYPFAAALALVAAVYLQVALAVDARLGGATPDLVVLVLLGIALRWGPVGGAVAGFAAGLVLDLAVVQPIGGSALILVAVGWAMGYLLQRGPGGSLLSALGVLAAGVLLRGLLDLAAAAIVGTPIVDPLTQAGTTVVGAFLTLIVALPILVLVRRRRVDPPLAIPVAAASDDATVELQPEPTSGAG